MIQLLAQTKSHIQKTAIISNGTDYTYEQLVSRSSEIATTLLSGRSDLMETRVAFLVDPSFEYTACLWGIWRAGGIAVPLCVLHPLSSMEYVLKDAQVDVLLVTKQYKETLATTADKHDIQLWCLEDIASSGHSDLPKISPDRRAMILYTSGTTSLPKGVVTTHQNIEFQIRTLVDAWHWKSSDHILNILPLHHVHGIINVMSCALWSGAICEFHPKFDASRVWETFSKGRLSLFMAVPTIYYKLISYWKSQSAEVQQNLRASCSSFRLMVSGSAALPIPVLTEWESITGMRLLERYGMTEIGMALSNPYLTERRPGHVGQPLPGVEIRLANESDELVSKRMSGEIQIKGPNVFLEYWKKPEATAKAFTTDGWFKSGDIAVFEDGYYKILGRNSVDIIKSGGYKISALEIESVLLNHPDIEQCGVVGIEDLEWGEIVSAALVSSNSNLSGEYIRHWLSDKLPAYKVPRKYIFIDDLPKNTLGKVTKNKLKDLF